MDNTKSRTLNYHLIPSKFWRKEPPRRPVREMAMLTESQISQLLVTAKVRRWEALYHLAIVSGMGQSELLGLKCTDLGWIKQTLRVEPQIVLPDGNGVLFSAPKTMFGKFSIVLGGMTIELLREHYARQNEERIAAREGWKELGLIYTTKIGTPIDQHNLIRSFKMLLKQAGIAPVRFHALRYTSASSILNHDIPMIVVSRRLGHARTSITMDVYGNLIPSMQEEAAELIDELVTPTEVKLENPIAIR